MESEGYHRRSPNQVQSLAFNKGYKNPSRWYSELLGPSPPTPSSLFLFLATSFRNTPPYPSPISSLNKFPEKHHNASFCFFCCLVSPVECCNTVPNTETLLRLIAFRSTTCANPVSATTKYSHGPIPLPLPLTHILIVLFSCPLSHFPIPICCTRITHHFSRVSAPQRKSQCTEQSRKSRTRSSFLVLCVVIFRSECLLLRLESVGSEAMPEIVPCATGTK